MYQKRAPTIGVICRRWGLPLLRAWYACWGPMGAFAALELHRESGRANQGHVRGVGKTALVSEAGASGGILGPIRPARGCKKGGAAYLPRSPFHINNTERPADGYGRFLAQRLTARAAACGSTLRAVSAAVTSLMSPATASSRAATSGKVPSPPTGRPPRRVPICC